MLPLAVLGSVVSVCVASLLALRWVLAHREKKLEHAPLLEMQAKLDSLEQRMVSGAFRRG